MKRFAVPIVVIPLLLLMHMAFISVAPNRLATGMRLDAEHATHGWGVILIGSLTVSIAARIAGRPMLQTMGAIASLVTVSLFAGEAAIAAILHRGTATRVGLDVGAWAMLVLSLMLLADGWRRLAARDRVISAACVVAALTTLIWSGALRDLSIVVEYRSHRAEFATALIRHTELVLLTVAFATAIGVPAAIALHRRPRLRAPVIAVLNVVQTVPSIALFGLLITPLVLFGLSGIGVVPAVIALVLYALLPAVANTLAGLDGVPPALREAADALGFPRRARLAALDLPLALPAIVAGLRIMTVQAVGLAVVAALIGAGGLGDFVFQGLGQYATDLVLLGALPAVALALAADRLLGFAADRLTWRLT